LQPAFFCVFKGFRSPESSVAGTQNALSRQSNRSPQKACFMSLFSRQSHGLSRPVRNPPEADAKILILRVSFLLSGRATDPVLFPKAKTKWLLIVFALRPKAGAPMLMKRSITAKRQFEYATSHPSRRLGLDREYGLN